MGNTTDFVTVNHPRDEDQQMTNTPTPTLTNLPDISQKLRFVSEKIQKESTTLVIDANVLLNHNEVFSYLVQSRWTVAVPTHGKELHALDRSVPLLTPSQS
jgi:hypothetical protein